MLKPRLIELDIVRIFACWCILTIHFNASICGYDIAGNFIYPNNFISNNWFGCYLGDIGVGLFFILSAASLEFRYPVIELSGAGLFNFYMKRAKTLYPMFWIAFVSAYVLFLDKSFFAKPIKYLPISIIGLDGYISALGFGYLGTFYRLGEWFLGCILILYLLYPLLAHAFHYNWRLCSLFCLALYVFSIRQIRSIWFFLQFPYFLLGIAFIRFFRGDAQNKNLWIASLICVIFRMKFGHALNPWTKAIVTSWLIFIFIALLWQTLSPFFNRLVFGQISRTVTFVSGLTYPLFLVHHVLISHICSHLDLTAFSNHKTILIYFVYILMCFILSFLLKFLYTFTIHCVFLILRLIRGEA